MLYEQMFSNHLPTLRRDPSETPPWKRPANSKPADVFQEDWGGTFDEMLMMPASVKCKTYCWMTEHDYYVDSVLLGLCPELQELYTMCTSNAYSLPFPLKKQL